MIGNKITDPFKIMEVARNRKSIYHKNSGIIPAAIIQNWQFHLVIRAINMNLLYEYEPKKKKSFSETMRDIRKPLIALDKKPFMLNPYTPEECYINIIDKDEENE